MDQLTLAGTSGAWGEPRTIQTKRGGRIRVRYNLVTTVEQLRAMCAHLIGSPEFDFDTETSGLNPALGASICGYSFGVAAWPHYEGYYVPVRHCGPDQHNFTQVAAEAVAGHLAPVLRSPGRAVGHNAKFDLRMLRAEGLEVAREVICTALEATTADENHRYFGLKPLMADYGFAEARTEENGMQNWLRADARNLGMHYRKSAKTAADAVTYLDRFGYSRAPIDMSATYAIHDVLYTAYLHKFAFGWTEHEFPAVWAREHRIQRLILDMESHGLPADAEEIRRAHDLTAEACAHWLAEIRRLSGLPNFEATPAEIQGMLFEHLKMVPQKKTATEAPSIDKEARNLLAATYPEHQALLHGLGQLALVQKLHSTYAVGFAKLVSPQGRIHPSYNQLERKDDGGAPVTGRLSSSEPNAQNIASNTAHLWDCACKACAAEKGIPEGVERSVSVRRYFTVPEGHVRVYIDFAQVELRVLTWFCQDATLLRAFQNGEDVLQAIADDLSIVRKVAKAVAYGTSYGMQGPGLAKRLPGYYEDPAGTEVYAEEVLQAFFRRYSGISEFRDATAKAARENGGLVVNPFGRPRRIPLVNSKKEWERSRAERQLMSSVISGTAADVMKESMIRSTPILATQSHGGRLVQTIHDEAVFDIPLREGWTGVVLALVAAMEDWPMFSHPTDRQGVPIKVGVEIATTNWEQKREVIIDGGSLRWAE